jgi:hypothetical protein
LYPKILFKYVSAKLPRFVISIVLNIVTKISYAGTRVNSYCEIHYTNFK